MVTNENIDKVIIDHLKENRIRYSMVNCGKEECLLEIYCGSIAGNILIEYAINDEDVILVQFYFDTHYFSVFTSDRQTEDEAHSALIGEVDELVDKLKRYNTAISKIKSKLDEIEGICNEYELSFSDYISLNYDFG